MRSVKSVMRVATALIAPILGFLVVPRVGAEEGPVWCWFAACGGPAMGIEIQLDDSIVYQSVFPVCRVDRADPVGQGQRGWTRGHGPRWHTGLAGPHRAR